MKAEFIWAGFGKLVVAILSGFIGYSFTIWLANFIDDKKREWQIKHRFDKPPIAKCYCIDCEFHGGQYPNSCRLPGSSRCTPPSGFCYEARPRKKK